MKYPNINAERSRNGMTFDELAKRLGVSRRTVYNWLYRGSIPVKALCDLADLFDVDVDYLLGR